MDSFKPTQDPAATTDFRPDATLSGGSPTTIVRAEHKRDFVQVTNSLARDDRLEYGARGLAESLLSRRHVGTFDSRALAAQCKREGRATIRRYLAQLEEFRYLRRRTVRVAGGRIVTQTVLCEDPDAPDPFAILDAAEGEKCQVVPTAHRRATGRPVSPRRVGNPPKTTHMNTCAEVLSTPHPPTRTCARETPAPTLAPDSVVFPPHVTQARELLTELRRDAPKLALSEREIDHLTQLAAQWLARGVPYHRVVYALTCGLPERINAAARLVEYRLRHKMPPPDPTYLPPWPPQADPSPRVPAQSRGHTQAPAAGFALRCRCGKPGADTCLECLGATADRGMARVRAAWRKAHEPK